MENNNISRRKFIKQSVGMGALMFGGSQILSSCSTLFRTTTSSSHYDLKGLPSVILGKTGIRIPRIALGLGSRFCNIVDPDESTRILNYALDNGLYYWDTAWVYENTKLGIVSEERLGETVNKRRNEIFLSTKVTSRNPDEAMRQIETSLKRLKTDHVDMLMIHDVQNDADVARLSEKGGLIDILHKMKDQKITRFIGFSGHTEANALNTMAGRGDFDNMLMAMNHWNGYKQNRQELVIPTAKEKGMGVILMKVVRPKESIKGLDANELVRFALSLKGPDGIVLGMESMEVVKANIENLRNFKPMDDERMKTLAMELTPFYNHENLPWMANGYRDGNWV